MMKIMIKRRRRTINNNTKKNDNDILYNANIPKLGHSCTSFMHFSPTSISFVILGTKTSLKSTIYI